ncbi:hypothetical protein R6Q57_029873 [Mikania cordata]
MFDEGMHPDESLHSSGRSKVPSDIQQAVSRSGMSVRKFSLYTPAGRKVAGEGEGDWARSIRSEFPIQIEAPIKKILPSFSLLFKHLFEKDMHLFKHRISIDLSYQVPTSFGNLKGLTHLDLSSNELSGELPSSLASIINLVGLYHGHDLTDERKEVTCLSQAIVETEKSLQLPLQASTRQNQRE